MSFNSELHYLLRNSALDQIQHIRMMPSLLLLVNHCLSGLSKYVSLG